MDSPALGAPSLAMAQAASISVLVEGGVWSSHWRRGERGEGLLCGKEVCRGEGDWLGECCGSGEESEEGSGPWQ